MSSSVACIHTLTNLCLIGLGLESHALASEDRQEQAKLAASSYSNFFFCSNSGGSTKNKSSSQDVVRGVEGGTGLVSIERQNTTTKIVAPGVKEKEVVYTSKLDVEPAAKLLRNLPGTKWSRTLAISCIRLLVSLIVGLALMAT